MLALRAARVFDGERLVDRPVVLIEGETIVDVGVRPPAQAEVIDLGDATLLPGLVDCHQHLVFSCAGTLEEQVSGFSDDELRERARRNALQALAAGITTIRDVGDRDFVTLSLRDDPSLPTLLCAGTPITIKQGHCWYLGGECDPDALADAVVDHAQRGCDLIKVMVSGGGLTPTIPMSMSQFSTEQMRTIVDTAHAHGLPVAAHCHGVDSIRSAIEAGVDTVEHCTFMDENNDAHPDDDLLKRMATAGIPVSATLGALPGFTPPPFVVRNLDTVIAGLGRFRGHGGKVVVGTDAGISAGKPHDIARHALRHLLQMGLPRVDALRAMTADGAGAIGLGDRKGRLAPGYDADVLAVAGDPVTGDGDLLTPVGVWRGGRRVS
jgi:imidazolonepropionase-like amidohydrolase